MDYFTPHELVLSRKPSATQMSSTQELEDSLRGVLRNIENMKRIAFDIGQTVVKIAYTSTFPKRITTDEKTLIDSGNDSLRLHCIQIRLDDFETVLDFIAAHGKITAKTATYSGASNITELSDLITAKLGLELIRINHMDCLVNGTNFLIRNIESESFTYDHHNETCRYQFETFRPSSICPYLVINVGTGISVFKVESDDKYERVGGSSLGGGSFFGLAQLLTDDMHTDLDELLKMAEDGDHRLIDTLVSDIYGHGVSLGLTGDLIAGSFGKCSSREESDIMKNHPDYKKNVVRSLLLMISNSIGQLAFLYAQKENVRRIYFDGFLIRNHAIIMRTIGYALDFWSEGMQQAHFLRHEGYTTAIGAFLKGGALLGNDVAYGIGDEGARYSWREYYTGCSDLGRFVPTAPLSAGFTAGVLELECTDMILRPFPLLADMYQDYKPDVCDLSQDADNREFWLNTMRDSCDKMMKKALESQENTSTAASRASVFKEKFNKQLEMIRAKSFAYGNCNVRNLLDLREQILNEQGFDDSMLTQKAQENASAMLHLASTIRTLDSYVCDEERLFYASKGLLAGNVFDWGAKQVIDLMESSEGLSFGRAVDTIPERPWLIDTYDEFAATLKRKNYRCAAVFVDNSGCDFLLGVIPFCRELIKRGTKVIIVSNLSPALNDLTYSEMMGLINKMCAIDKILDASYKNGSLMFHHSGQGSPCLDLRKVNSELNKAVIVNGVDLVIIEGMGRALHTNLNANFVCDSLKAAVIKTQWLADRMGGQLFSVVFKFEKGRHENFKDPVDASAQEGQNEIVNN